MRRRNAAALGVAVAAVAIAGGLLAWRRPEGAMPALGMVRQTQIRIAAETSGRLTAVMAVPGQHVEQGAPLAMVDSPELVAALAEARAELAAAQAERDRILVGARREEIAIAIQAVHTAEANLLLAQQQQVRAAALAQRSVASRQQFDESTAGLARAQAMLALRRAELAAAAAGPTTEERTLAEARVGLATAALAAQQAALDKAHITAPASGIVAMQVAEIGEVLSPGKVVLTLLPDNSQYLAFMLREDRLPGIALGAVLSVRLGTTVLTAKVTAMERLGDFAAWRAARAVGDHDLNTFQIRLEPLEQAGISLASGEAAWLGEHAVVRR